MYVIEPNGMISGKLPGAATLSPAALGRVLGRVSAFSVGVFRRYRVYALAATASQRLSSGKAGIHLMPPLNLVALT